MHVGNVLNYFIGGYISLQNLGNRLAGPRFQWEVKRVKITSHHVLFVRYDDVSVSCNLLTSQTDNLEISKANRSFILCEGNVWTVPKSVADEGSLQCFYALKVKRGNKDNK